MTRKILESFSMEEAFKALNRKVDSKHVLSESKNVITESVDDDIAQVSAKTVGYSEFFADMVEDLADEEGTVANYYARKNTPRADLIVKKCFIINPKFMQDEDGNSWDISVEDYFEEGFAEEFGFQIANGDYLYTRDCHDVPAAYVKCRDYASMINYVKNGYNPDAWNAHDLIEESVANNINNLSESENTSNFLEIDPAEFGYGEDSFVTDVDNLAYAEDEIDGYQSVSTYYAEKQLPESDLRVVKIFINPAMYIDDEGEFSDLDYDAVEEFGFKLANGDCLYTRSNHDVGPAFVKCKNFASMRNYVINGYKPDSANAHDLIED